MIVTPKSAKVVSAGAPPVGLELGSEGRGVDLAQRPVPSPSWRQEVGLGAVEDDEGDGAGLDHVVPVERDSAKIAVEVSSDQDWSRRKLPTP